jgi:hypothetical protein
MGPAIVITIGVLFLLGEMRGGFFDFGNTYPVILIVIGAISLAAALAPMEGHIEGGAPSVPAPTATAPGSTPGALPPPSAGQGQ